MAVKIRCEQNEQVSLWMSLALDGLLDTDLRRELDQHLTGCPDCRAQWTAMRRVSTVLEEAPMAGPPLGFSLRVERRLAERAQKRRQWFGAIAVLTSSLSLAGFTVTTVLLVLLGFRVWSQLGSPPAMQQGSSAVLRAVSRLSVTGKVVSPFLKDLLVRYGLPLTLLVAAGLVLLVGLWVWLYRWHLRHGHRNGYA